VPVNWASSGFDIDYVVCGYSIQDAYNLITKKALELGVEWLIIIEDDVMIPPNLFIKFAEYIDAGREPVVSGLYYTKADPGEPLIFRGRGNGAYQDFKFGDKVRCDGLPMGCLLLHTSLLRWMWEREEQYKAIDGADLRRVFETPKQIFYDPEKGGLERLEGTQDLHFFDRIIMNKVLKKTGWKKLAKKKYSFLCYTSIFCQHIDRATGVKYPLPPKNKLK
jgi:hypothetical protein